MTCSLLFFIKKSLVNNKGLYCFQEIVRFTFFGVNIKDVFTNDILELALVVFMLGTYFNNTLAVKFVKITQKIYH